MQVMKWSVIALAVAAGTTQMAVAANQSESKGFVEDSTLTLLNRNFYFNRDFKNNPGGQSYREEWAHGVMAEYASGFTQGTVGFGVDAYGYLGLKLDSGKGTRGTGLLPIGSDGRAEDDYSEAGGAVKLRVSATELKYGEMRTAAPVFATSDSRLLPETATGFLVTSNEIEGLALEAGHFTAYNNRNSTNSDDELLLNYGSGEIGKTIDFAGGFYTISDDLTVGLYASEFEDTWRQYYGNVNYNIGLAEDQALNFDFNIYRTSDTGDELQGDISNTTWSLAAAYSIGAHKFTLAHQRVNGDTPFDYVGGDSIFLANSVQYSDFNGANEKSWQARYDLDLKTLGVPGLKLMARYVTGDDIDGTDADAAGGYAGLYGEDGKHWERDLEAKYTLQDGPAKDLSFRVRHAVHRANTDQGEGDLNEVRVIVEYPLSIL
ncbi:OprD family porin [Pseudomonas indica]|uniref:Imipenem/basic amino acid-specific outer membrane pore n=1 Tax=Pseudomonas indica TaxID=137658 RepID=A0A1G8W0L8_9PSED|nr:OprD family porin [Pseudomonas indica]SDJ71603.1 imipenem/basic amino acid-specific outer membrane pore [Pseudomonas indica]